MGDNKGWWIAVNNPCYSPFDNSGLCLYFCSSCGKQNDRCTRFCPNCGNEKESGVYKNADTGTKINRA